MGKSRLCMCMPFCVSLFFMAASQSPSAETPTTSGRVGVELENDHVQAYGNKESLEPTRDGVHSPGASGEERPHTYSDGCLSRNRSGLFHLRNVAACPGEWEGHVRSADAVCAPGWKVRGLEVGTIVRDRFDP